MCTGSRSEIAGVRGGAGRARQRSRRPSRAIKALCASLACRLALLGLEAAGRARRAGGRARGRVRTRGAVGAAPLGGVGITVVQVQGRVVAVRQGGPPGVCAGGGAGLGLHVLGLRTRRPPGGAFWGFCSTFCGSVAASDAASWLHAALLSAAILAEDKSDTIKLVRHLERSILLVSF